MSKRVMLQAGYLLVAAAAVVMADLVADQLAVLAPTGAAAPFVAVSGRVAAGFAVGMAFRLQISVQTRPDRRFRLWVGVPCAVVAACPALLAAWPGALPAWDTALTSAQRLAPFAGVVLGLTHALAIRTGRR